jgi:23S rRNA (pseudouridine1915-N3)-methyltransferase
MKLNLIAVGSKMPAWVEAGVGEYRKRLPKDFELQVIEIPMGIRTKTANLPQVIAREGDTSLRAVGQGDYLVALEVKGRSLSTEELASRLGALRDEGRNVSFLVGGPDGLAPACLQAADLKWSLSTLTLPHPLVRIVLAEQLYRAWSILQNHPYHRG